MYDIEHYVRLLDHLGNETIRSYDAEEAGEQYGGGTEYEDSNGAFGFSALDRQEQAEILQAIDANLPTRTKRPNTRTGTSYAIKHAIEDYIGRYTSNLQCKTAMRILGYERSAYDLNPVFNITRKEWRAFCDVSRAVWWSRHSGKKCR